MLPAARIKGVKELGLYSKRFPAKRQPGPVRFGYQNVRITYSTESVSHRDQPARQGTELAFCSDLPWSDITLVTTYQDCNIPGFSLSMVRSMQFLGMVNSLVEPDVFKAEHVPKSVGALMTSYFNSMTPVIKRCRKWRTTPNSQTPTFIGSHNTAKPTATKSTLVPENIVLTGPLAATRHLTRIRAPSASKDPTGPEGPKKQGFTSRTSTAYYSGGWSCNETYEKKSQMQFNKTTMMGPYNVQGSSEAQRLINI